MRVAGMTFPRWTVSEALAGLVLGLCVVGHFLYAIHGWANSIGGMQEFRQAQTAIATHYIAAEGPMLVTKIPVLGPNWGIPFEFPAYQSLTALLHRVSGYPLDQSGRLVSLVCFYLCLVPLWWVLGTLAFERGSRLLTLALVASSPIYIFWSRTFLIESLALLLALTFTALVMRAVAAGRQSGLVLAAGFGVLAALTKFTTFSIALGFLLLWLGSLVLVRIEPTVDRSWRRVWPVVVTLLLPVGAGVAWSRFISRVWLQSPLTEVFADTVHAWNLGTWQQRGSGEFWGRVFDYGIRDGTVTFVPWLIGLAAWAFAPLRWRVVGLCALGAWFAGPLVWTNLFFVHNYYFYATTVFGAVWICASITGVAHRWPQLRVPGWIVIGALCAINFSLYPQSGFFNAQANDWGRDKAGFAQQVAAHVAPQEILLVIGEDWSPVIPYYSGRYAIMVRWPNQINGPKLAAALQRAFDEGRPVGGMVRSNDTQWDADCATAINRLGLDPNPTLIDASGRFSYYSKFNQ
jgi:4-amino-4-deoxy-L-arabinose transferase-like glycosyltransferase